MTEKIDSKKMNKLKQGVYDILERNRCSDENKDNITHTAFGMFNGKFSLDKMNRKELMLHYTKAVVAGIEDLSILERPKEYAPIIVDIDLKIPEDDYEEGTRLYSNELMLTVINKYTQSINKYLDVPEDKFKICIFEKDHPTEKDGIYKDGFHIMFPEICAQTQMRHLIRYNAVKSCEEDEVFAGYLEGTDKIIDKAVVASNAWFLYGSRKPGGQTYKLTYIYDGNLNKTYDADCLFDMNGEPIEPITTEQMIDYFSLQSTTYAKKYATPIQDEYAESDIDAECEKLGINTSMKAELPKYDVPLSKEHDVRRASKYTSMLNENRSSNYQDWINVGLALHNVDQSLLPAWIEFSKKCSKKYKDGECDKFWRGFKNSSGNVLTIRSLAYWAKQDDPKQYEAFNKEEFKNIMRETLNGDTYHLAKSFHYKYANEYVCTSPVRNTWYQFRHHRWEKIEGGFSIKIKFSEEFANEFNKEIAEISIKLTKSGGIEKEELQQRRTRLDKIVEKLLNTTFKKTLLDECANQFYDPKFEEKLDSNINLIGFENGVYDLEKGEFRDGRPDDYISLSTKNEYVKWNEKHPYNAQIQRFLSQILPNENVRKYFINALASCLSGSTKDEKLFILTGSGSNGKSLIMELMNNALNDYFMSCDISVITRKRGQSNQAAPEKVRMKGRRCGVFQEADDGEKLNVGVMKEFSGGDKILVRDLFKGSAEMLEFKPQMKYFLTCNQLPEVPSNDDGTWRRLRVIAFTSKFVDKPSKPNEFMIDTKLKSEKIHQWGPYFVSYLIHVYNSEYKNKEYLSDPEEVMASTKQYKAENDYIAEYIMDRLTVTTNPKNIIYNNTMWEDFKVWYKGVYERNPLPKKTEITKMLFKQLGIEEGSEFKCLVFNMKKEQSSIQQSTETHATKSDEPDDLDL
jgi:P4 family phage/plasmid primase-like protien